MARAVYGLVLAGGQSRRMGRDKAHLQRDGQSQLAYTVEVVAACVERVFVSARKDQQQDAERRQHELIVDRYDGMGPIAGILSAMDEYPDVDWLVLACDLPNVDAETLQTLLAERGGEQDFIAYSSSYDGLPEPLCAIYSADSKSVLQQFVDDGIACPRKIMIRSDTKLLQQTNVKSLDNINTPDDLKTSVLSAGG